MKTSDLTELQLDWAVAHSLHLNYRIKEKDDLSKHIVVLKPTPCPDRQPGCAVAHFKGEYFSPSTNWNDGGPIIERDKIELSYDGNEWSSTHATWGEDSIGFGPTPLVAAMRCYVASKLGDEVEIPKELIPE